MLDQCSLPCGQASSQSVHDIDGHCSRRRSLRDPGGLAAELRLVVGFKVRGRLTLPAGMAAFGQATTTSSEGKDNSLRNFPPDLAPTLLMPFMAILLMFSSTILTGRGTAWIWTAAISFGLAAIGVTLLFIAKWPLY